MRPRSRRHVLVAYGSRAGATREVAERMAATLRARGIPVDIASVGEVHAVSSYRALVVGSSVYHRSWLPEAIAFVRQHHHTLARRPLWLFSVGTFDDTHPLLGRLIKREPRQIAEFIETLQPLGYRVFAGVIEHERWSRLGSLVHHAFGGRDGDNRNWPEIDAWARGIAEELNLRTVEARLNRNQTSASPSRKPRLFRRVKATRAERKRRLPGDRLIDRSMATLTHAITIEAAASEVWPWLVQMGAGTRAGWYSYDRLDNGGRRSAEHIIPALQTISLGALFPARPGTTDGFHVLQYEPRRSLVLGWRGGDGVLLVTWTFVSRTVGPTRTRLVVRARGSAKYPIYGLRRWLGLPLIRMVHFIMQRKQLLGIARRAESQNCVTQSVERRVA